MVSPLACPTQVGNVLGCSAVPLGSHSVVLSHTLPIFVHLSDGELPIGVALGGSLSKPFQCLLKISLSKSPLLIRCAEPHLRVLAPHSA
jgi:hypothetical protein